MNTKIKKIENVLVKLIAIHLILLILSQILIQTEEAKPYLSKTIQYEGVYNQYTENVWKH